MQPNAPYQLPEIIRYSPSRYTLRDEVINMFPRQEYPTRCALRERAVQLVREKYPNVSPEQLQHDRKTMNQALAIGITRKQLKTILFAK